MDNNARVGELRGRSDTPSEEPGKSADADHGGTPAPEWNETESGKLWRIIREFDANYTPPDKSGPDKGRRQYEKPSPDDRPAERPPTGEELKEMDAPGASNMDRARKDFMDADFLEDSIDAFEYNGREGLDIMPSDRPNAKAEVCVPMPTKEHLVQGPGMDGGELMTGMLVAGIMIGHGVMKARDMRTEWKERRDARSG